MTIVHNQYFKEVLIADYGFEESLVDVVSPGIWNINGERKSSALSRPGAIEADSLKNVLVFGFLTSYKLPELVVEAAIAMKEDPVRFTFCVSANPRTNSKAYLARYESLRNSVFALGEKATWSGYIPDEEVPEVFENADLLILPYVDCISVSAVASLAISHGVKICYSSALSPVFPSSHLEFELSVPSLTAAITKAVDEDVADSGDVSSLNSWADTAKQTAALWETVMTRRPANRQW